MKKFDYKVVAVYISTDDGTVELNVFVNMGAEGWELIALKTTDASKWKGSNLYFKHLATFKRELETGM